MSSQQGIESTSGSSCGLEGLALSLSSCERTGKLAFWCHPKLPGTYRPMYSSQSTSSSLSRRQSVRWQSEKTHALATPQPITIRRPDSSCPFLFLVHTSPPIRTSAPNFLPFKVLETHISLPPPPLLPLQSPIYHPYLRRDRIVPSTDRSRTPIQKSCSLIDEPNLAFGSENLKPHTRTNSWSIDFQPLRHHQTRIPRSLQVGSTRPPLDHPPFALRPRLLGL